MAGTPSAASELLDPVVALYLADVDRIREERPEGTRTRVVCEVWCEKDDAIRILIGEASAVR